MLHYQKPYAEPMVEEVNDWPQVMFFDSRKDAEEAVDGHPLAEAYGYDIYEIEL